MSRLRGLVHSCIWVAVLGASPAFANVTVQPGDTLWSIARAHGTTPAALMDANGLAHDTLTPGQVLVLPGEAPAAQDPSPAATAAPAPAAPAPALAPTATARTHVVASGDNLWSIAREYDTTVAALMTLNGLTSDTLRPGLALRVPAGGTTTPQAVPTLTHVVETGDSLWSIARRYDTTVAALMAANALAGDTLRPGLELTVPSGTSAVAAAPATPAAAPAATPADTATPTAVAPQTAPEPTLNVVVEAGDSLYEIALRYDVTVDDLIAWNDLDGTLIRPGQTLSLRAPANAPTVAPLVVHVESGDSLWALARRYGTSVDALAAANGISANATLRVGQAVSIPGQYAPIHATSGAAGADVGGAALAEVRVVPGDNLWKIARQYNTTIAALMALNGLATDRLQVGQSLRVAPGPELGAVAAAATPLPDLGDGMVWPLVGQITSRFGYRRLRITGSNMHYGLDIDGEIGDPIRAATSGTVSFAGWRGGFGNLVIITQGDTEYYYAHASALLVQEGQTVGAGQVIARVGATGTVTGSHLHFEIRVAGTAVDPLPILEARASR